MRILNGLKRLLQFVTDPDTYCLLWLALRNRAGEPVQTPPRTASARNKRAVGNTR